MVAVRALLVAATAVALSGCGGSDSAGNVATSPPTPAATTANGPFSPGAASPTPAGGASPTPSTGATTAVTEYFDAARSGDCSAAFALLTDPLRSRVVSADGICKGDSPDQQNTSATVGTSSGDALGHQVSVQVAVTATDGSVHTDSVIVVLDTGTWKISDILISPSAGGAAGHINMDTITANIQQQYAAQAGAATITLSCPRSGSFPASPGDTFQCDFTDSSGRKGKLTVNVTSSRGDYTWSVG